MNKVAEYGKWIIYQRADGVYEAWKSKNVQEVYVRKNGSMIKLAKDVERRILSSTTIGEAMDEIRRFKRPRIVKTYDPNKDPNQTRIE